VKLTEPASKVACRAMATRFEIFLHGGDPAALRAAGEEALDEIRRLETRLSLYLPTSEIARVNAAAAHRPTRVSHAVFQLLLDAQRLHRETGGAFDITIGPLVRCWGFMGGKGSIPKPEELAQARARVGMEHVILDAQECSVRFDREGVMIDLGAIGKGYAIDCGARTLREAGVAGALLHGGTSSVFAIGHPPEAPDWKIELASPPPIAGQAVPAPALVCLRDEALSVSAGWGKSFEAGGKTYGHVLDPRTGAPADGAVMAAVVLPSATETDALSTALLVAGAEEAGRIGALRPGMRSLVVTRGAPGGGWLARGNL
jgi:thiamine biosynthesis lipoprotein